MQKVSHEHTNEAYMKIHEKENNRLESQIISDHQQHTYEYMHGNKIVHENTRTSHKDANKEIHTWKTPK